MAITRAAPKTSPRPAARSVETQANSSAQKSESTAPAIEAKSAEATTPTVSTATPQSAESARLRSQNDLQAGLLENRLNFDVGSGASTQNPEVTRLADKAMKGFETRVTQVLNRDASSLAMGKTPTEPGNLSDAQLDNLQGAAGDYFKNLPVGALSDKARGPLEAGLNSAGADTSNLDTTLVKDLGDLGADAAKNFAQDLRENKPGVFYAAAGATALAGAAVAYTQGSEALGIKPEFSKDFGKTEVSVGAEWGARLKDPSLSLHVARTFGEHQVGVGAEYKKGEYNPTLSYAFDSQRLDVDALVTLGDVPSGNVNATYKNDNLSMFARAQFGEDVTDKLSLGSNYRINSDSTLGTAANYNFETDSFDATVSYGYKPTENLDLQLRGGYNDTRGGFVGLGLTARF